MNKEKTGYSKNEVTYARNFLKTHKDDPRLVDFIHRVKQSEMNEWERISVIEQFLKLNYSPHMGADLIAGLAYWNTEGET